MFILYGLNTEQDKNINILSKDNSPYNQKNSKYEEIDEFNGEELNENTNSSIEILK